MKLHPGMVVVLSRFAMDEIDVSRAIMTGDLASPQPYENMYLFALRITGTGFSYRPKYKEWVYRRDSVYLTDKFLARCNGLPVIFDHPEGAVLNSKEFASRIVGTVILPYIKDSEVWAIAKIFDDETIKLLRSEQLSTSPSVVFRDKTVNYTVELENGETLLVEGSPSALDHIAICERGVWDQGGAPVGIRVDTAAPDLHGAVVALSDRMFAFAMNRAAQRLAQYTGLQKEL